MRQAGRGDVTRQVVPSGPGGLDLYVLYRAAGAARYPLLAAWVVRHRVTAGFRPGHAARHRHVLVIGTPEGMDLPSSCRVKYMDPEAIEGILAADPQPSGLFEEV